MPNVAKQYAPIEAKAESELLHLLAGCGFVGNETHTAHTHKPVNPMNVRKAYHELRAYFRHVEAAAKAAAKKKAADEKKGKEGGGE